MYDQFLARRVIVTLTIWLNLCLFVSIRELLFTGILHFHLQQISEFELFTLDDIDSAFQNVTRLTYSQNYHLSGKIFRKFWLLIH